MGLTPAARLRELIRRPGGLLLPGAFDALAARVVEDSGFDAAYVTGAGVANAFFGVPDLGFVGLTDIAAHVAAMAEAVDIPLVVDADTGFGNAVQVGRTVRVLERAGAAAIQLEDQVAPKRCGHVGGQEVISAEEMEQKLCAALDARRDSDTVIIARTDARAAHGLADALSRAEIYAAAGADVLFIEGLHDAPELHAAAGAAPGAPKLANIVEGGKTPMLPRAELHAMGYAIVLYANAALQGAIHGMQAALEGLRDSGVLEPGVTPFADRRLVHQERYARLEARYAA
jgi:2-methylisocitrate lyase-like PEP mutase family enzyme